MAPLAETIRERYNALFMIQNDSETRIAGPLNYWCDGDCGVNFTYASDIYVCKDCLDVHFDPLCMQRLNEEDTLELEICNKNHDFLYVPKYDAERAHAVVGRANVRVGERAMLISITGCFPHKLGRLPSVEAIVSKGHWRSNHRTILPGGTPSTLTRYKYVPPSTGIASTSK